MVIRVGHVASPSNVLPFRFNNPAATEMVLVGCGFEGIFGGDRRVVYDDQVERIITDWWDMFHYLFDKLEKRQVVPYGDAFLEFSFDGGKHRRAEGHLFLDAEGQVHAIFTDSAYRLLDITRTKERKLRVQYLR